MQQDRYEAIDAVKRRKTRSTCLVTPPGGKAKHLWLEIRAKLLVYNYVTDETETLLEVERRFPLAALPDVDLNKEIKEWIHPDLIIVDKVYRVKEELMKKLAST